MTTTELKQRLTAAINAPAANWELLRSCLTHIEEMERNYDDLRREYDHYAEQTNGTLREECKRHAEIRDELQSQLSERDAQCAAMREALDSVWDIEEMGYTVNDPEGESGHSTCNKCEAQLPHGGHAENCPQPIIEKALSTTAGRELLDELERLRKFYHEATASK